MAYVGGPKLGVIVRLFTASAGRPDAGQTDLEGTPGWERWMYPVVTLDQFAERLDLAASVGATGIEITQAGQPSGGEYLLRSTGAREDFVGLFAQRGLTIASLNCSGMPLHPVKGKSHRELIYQTIRLAELLGIRKIVTMSGIGGDGPDSTTVNWGFLPWPDDMVALLERQWVEGIDLWREIAAFAGDHGIERIALELHPLHLAYNVPTLLRLREAIGPIIGANVDPSHLFWQSMDPLAVVRALPDSIYHVQLKDTVLVPDQLAIAGVLDSRPFSDPSKRAWIQRTIGRGHDRTFWAGFLDALREVGYSDYMSIENEDQFQSYEDGVREAAEFLQPLLAAV